MAPGSTEETLGPVLNVQAQSLDVLEVFAYGALWALVGDKSAERGNRNDLQLNTAHGRLGRAQRGIRRNGSPGEGRRYDDATQRQRDYYSRSEEHTSELQS